MLRLLAQENVQAESAMMVPDVRLRLEHALGELTSAVVRAGRLETLAGGCWGWLDACVPLTAAPAERAGGRGWSGGERRASNRQRNGGCSEAALRVKACVV